MTPLDELAGWLDIYRAAQEAKQGDVADDAHCQAAVAAAGAGLLLGWGVFLNYGLALMALPSVGVR